VRVRVEYEKGDAVRFLSHLDVARVIKMALFRARWPVEMSKGFSPRPKIAFYSPLPVGTAGRQEYFDADLDETRIQGNPVGSLRVLAERISLQFPKGISLRSIHLVPRGESSLEARIRASQYEVDIKGVKKGRIGASLDAFLKEDSVPFEVVRPGGAKTLDLRPFVLSASLREGGALDRIFLDMTLKHDEGRTIRPQWVLAALQRFDPVPGEEFDPREAIVDRTRVVFGK